MSNPYFDFKQFRVQHDRCAMRVGTDAVVLAAWANLAGAKRILDIGTGSGVIALMVAQRVPEAAVTGIDIDLPSVNQARENGLNSPFAERLLFEVCDVRKFTDEEGFDSILCNPPFFTEDTLPPAERRATARNSAMLPFAELLSSTRRLLKAGGCLHVVLPTTAEPEFTRLALAEGLYLQRMCRVFTTERKPSKRVMLTYEKKENNSTCAFPIHSKEADFEKLVLMENGGRSKAYQTLTADFYLDCPPAS